MAVKTHLSPSALPGKTRSFTPKTAYVGPVWTDITIKGIDLVSGKYVIIKGKYTV